MYRSEENVEPSMLTRCEAGKSEKRLQALVAELEEQVMNEDEADAEVMKRR